jgi:signal transduction histidine kinase
MAEQQLIDTTRALALATESHVEAAVRRLRALAESVTLGRGDLPRFTAELQSALARAEFLELGLFSPAGRLLVGEPHRAAQGVLNNDVLYRIVQSRQPYISDFVKSPLSGRPAVVLTVPAIDQKNGVTYVLIGVPDLTHDLLTLMLEQRLPQKIGGGAVMDRRGVYIARTLNPESAVGHQASAGYLSRALASAEGIVRNVNPEGQTVYGTFVHTSFGWITAIGVPASYVEVPFKRTLVILGGVWFGGLAICIALSAIGSRRIANSLQDLATAARDTGHGHIPLPSAQPIAEVDLARRALIDAAERRERLLNEQVQARKAADAANRAKDEFLAMLSHELRNPLGAIANAVAVLDARNRPTQMVDRARGVIRRQIEHVSRLVDDLLDASRVTTGKIELSKRPLELSSLVRDTVDSLRTTKQLDRHDVILHLSRVWVDADTTRMEQIVSNLVRNAIKYTPEGGRVTIEVASDGDNAVLRVTDSGVGISAPLLPRIFDLFVQGERSLDRPEAGLGIGLTMVRSLVTMHGGTVDAQSDGPGRGSVFTVSLPAVAAPAAEPVVDVKTAPAVPGRRVLLVEDNDDARETFQLLLTLAGHEVYEAPDGLTALEVAASRAPDIAFVDVGLPGIDGYEVARRLRSKMGNSIVLIAVSGYGRPRDRERGLAAGFDAYLTKPVSPDQLAEALVTRAN